MKRRRLIFDIETSYGVYAAWQPGKIYLPPENMLREAKIICIAYKWAGDKRIHCLNWDEDQNDRQLIVDFMEVMDSADEIVAHNGDNFDIKWVRTRCLKHRIPMMPNYVSIDTLKNCRRLFRMHSNKLAQVAKFLGLDGKMDTGGMKLWMDVIERRSATALRKMIRYCKRDVQLLEEVFDILNPYMPHRSALDGKRDSCPECGSKKVYIRQRTFTVAGYERIKLTCNDCGKTETVAGSRVLVAS